ncbi:smoothelin isoform X2 [Microcaecilia unicolor]|uniref:Smoothelin isoform X2 n=1 Tax=Microcaecilia unicolor TaxID=1415580 RepID=A0A6P7ZEB6_9AMPH|nr:smoothelin isoform X2 [Microcaecilia unicolor]
MSEEMFSTMDEGTLRKLLEVTLDLAERRQIRAAIRELRRKELEGSVEALATKRFRSEKSSERQENKENRLRSQRLEEEQQKSLDLLSGKLEAIKDVEELTTLLRGTSEYEERKVIRAAIRKLRAEEIEAVSLAGQLGNCSKEGDNESLLSRGRENRRDLSASVVKEREDLEERQRIRSQIQEFRSAQNREAQNTGAKEMSSGMLLLLDPTSRELSSPSSSSSSFSSSEPATRHLSQSTDGYSMSTSSDVELEVGKDDRAETPCKDSWKEDHQDSSSGVEEDGEEKESDEVFQPVEMVSTGPVSPEKEKSKYISAEASIMEDLGSMGRSVQEELERSGQNRSTKFSKCSEDQMTPSRDEKDSVSKNAKDQVTSPPFQRADSVRDRAKKFTEESSSTNIKHGTSFANQKAEGAGSGSRVLQQQELLLLSASPAVRHRETPTSHRANEEKSKQNSEGLLQKRQDILPKSREDNRSAVTPGLTRGALGNSVQRGAKVGQGQSQNQADGASGSSSVSKGSAKPCDAKSFRSGSSKGPESQRGHSSGEGQDSSQEEISQVRHEGLRTDKQGDGFDGRSHVGQLESTRLTSQRRHIESEEKSFRAAEEPSTQPSSSLHTVPISTHSLGAGSGKDRASRTGEKNPTDANQEDMKTVFTIEIKDGRNQPTHSRVIGTPGNQRAELTLGLKPPPMKITSTVSSNARKMDAELVEPSRLAELPNGMEKAQEKKPERKNKLTAEELSAIEEEEVLDKMLDQTTDFEERRIIRTAMRELRQKKRDQREKERDQRLQEMKMKTQEGRRAGQTTEAAVRQSEKRAGGSSVNTITKTERLVHSNDGNKSSRTTTIESSYVKRSENGGTVVQTKSSFSSTSKKVGSIFDREDDASSRSSSLAALERRQAERKKEMMKAQNLPKTSATQARKAMIDKLEKESGSPSNPALSRVTVQRSSSFGVPNANSIKQMLLDWCKTKTRGYEHVDIQNFSSSWSDGMAFCALVHNFFPEAFDYGQLNPQNRRKNFDLAFSSAEKHADCPQLLDVEDMVRMREPDWKCVYTYIQEFYRCLVQKGLVKTKKS